MSAMTDVAAETRLVGGGLSSLPHVNLMPPEIAERAVMRKVQGALLGALGLAVAASGFLYYNASQSVSDAQTAVDTAASEQTSLQREKAGFANVTAVYAQTSAAEQRLVEAMGLEVRFSRFLNDLSLTLPENVWITNLAITQTAGSAAAAAPVAPGAVGAVPAVGTVTITGSGLEHNDVATWLESLTQVDGFSDQPYLQNSTKAEINDRPVVNWSTTVDLTSDALSGRYLRPAGN